MNIIDTERERLHLGAKFLRAIAYARDLHIETRKSTQVPYMAHLLGVASLVMGEVGYVKFPITEDEVVGALLHDAAEDCGGRERLADIRQEFGDEVTKHVEGCTDTFESPKPAWRPRKEAYIERIPREPLPTQLISAADKLYNARAILEDLRFSGRKTWERFNAGRDDQLWYYEELVIAFRKSAGNRIVDELERVVKLIREM